MLREVRPIEWYQCLVPFDTGITTPANSKKSDNRIILSWNRNLKIIIPKYSPDHQEHNTHNKVYINCIYRRQPLSGFYDRCREITRKA